MKAALETLALSSKRKVAILGDMFELGSDEEKMHYDVGEMAALAGIDVLIAIGERSAAMADAARKTAPQDMQVLYYASKDEVLPYLTDPAAGILKDADAILVKASHGMQFEKIVEALQSV